MRIAALERLWIYFVLDSVTDIAFANQAVIIVEPEFAMGELLSCAQYLKMLHTHNYY